MKKTYVFKKKTFFLNEGKKKIGDKENIKMADKPMHESFLRGAGARGEADVHAWNIDLLTF